MPLIDKVFNATLEKQEIMIHSKMYTLLPRSFCDVSEFQSPIMEKEHGDKGLVIIRAGDDFKSKEREALLKYLRTLENRIVNFQAWLDMKKQQGKTVDQPLDMKRAQRWKSEIEEMLNIEAPIVEELSFKSSEDRVTPNIFKQAPQVVENPYEEVAKKRGRPAKSFKDIGAEA